MANVGKLWKLACFPALTNGCTFSRARRENFTFFPALPSGDMFLVRVLLLYNTFSCWLNNKRCDFISICWQLKFAKSGKRTISLHSWPLKTSFIPSIHTKAKTRFKESMSQFVRHLQSVLIFILNHPRSFLVYYHFFGVFPSYQINILWFPSSWR